MRQLELELKLTDPKVGPWTCLGMLVLTAGIMAATAEFVSPCAPRPPVSLARLTWVVGGQHRVCAGEQ